MSFRYDTARRRAYFSYGGRQCFCHANSAKDGWAVAWRWSRANFAPISQKTA